MERGGGPTCQADYMDYLGQVTYNKEKVQIFLNNCKRDYPKDTWMRSYPIKTLKCSHALIILIYVDFFLTEKFPRSGLHSVKKSTKLVKSIRFESISKLLMSIALFVGL